MVTHFEVEVKCCAVLALLYHNQSRYEEAEPLYRRSLAICENALGPEHPNVATSLKNYVALLRDTDRDAASARLEARAQGGSSGRKRESRQPTPVASSGIFHPPLTVNGKLCYHAQWRA
ncbi:MAG: tetratricopeptide repeat protein [bacterium]|nr:tetratricopeptide repeat protein [bacterium]